MGSGGPVWRAGAAPPVPPGGAPAARGSALCVTRLRVPPVPPGKRASVPPVPPGRRLAVLRPED